MQRGFSLKELIVVCFIFGSLIPIVLPILKSKEERAQIVKCQTNLDQMGKSMKVYLSTYGRNVLFPQTNGAGFLTTLYHYSIIDDPDVFICPSTSDTNNDGQKLQKITGSDPDEINAVSYAARKNAKRKSYPNLFFREKCSSVTSMAADDLQGQQNHHQVFVFLFRDGHSDYLRYSTEKGRQQILHNCYDPLTN